ncbi:AAA family ATPase [Megasphaera stantonii]|uniref:AAA family ATPase n=1 Tax=Megasphaera stantonii TaxID=2144175 RepID=UPI00195ED4CF|nr:AAA family ATPase [Megasphaera stantonii]MBM6733043.1 AAA family ATPase [Megasphaera stantonii]
MNVRMPIGVDDFKELRENYYFIDKTDFIRQLIDDHSKVTLITRPRRFGKTVTMSMLEYFFSIDKKEESKDLFHGLAVEKAGLSYMKHRGIYPVIFISLKDGQSPSWEQMLNFFSLFLRRLYLQYAYLMKADTLDECMKEDYHRIVNRQADQTEMAFALTRLMEMMQAYYGQPVILLLDEYDAPIQYAWDQGYYDQCIGFMRQFLSSALKTNRALNFAVLTGVLRVAKESIFSGLNNLSVCSVLTRKYSNILGFTPAETAVMAEDLGVEKKLPELRQWYDGYRFGTDDIYNPWSVINYMDNECTPMPYWVHTSGNYILKQLLSHADCLRIKELQGLLDGKTVTVSLNETVIYDQIEKDASALYTLLLTTGYLTIESASPTTYNRYSLRIPNEEIKQVYGQEILNTIAVGADRNTFDTLFDALFSGQEKDFEGRLQQILLRFASTYDTANKESFYHGFMLGISALFLDKQYIVESNRESGYGRFDIAIFPKDTQKAGVILEFKAADRTESLEEKAGEALRQIQDKQYEAEFAKRDIASLWKYGVAFCGKQVYVKMI